MCRWHVSLLSLGGSRFFTLTLYPCYFKRLACRYHGNGEVIRREEFTQRKQAAEELQLARLNTKAKRLASAGKKFDGLPVLQVYYNRQGFDPHARTLASWHAIACLNHLQHLSRF